MNEYRVATTKELEIINKEALSVDLNRAIDPEAFDDHKIDVNGLHVLAREWHLQDGLIRTEWLTKFTNIEEPKVLFVDVAVNNSVATKALGKLQKVGFD